MDGFIRFIDAARNGVLPERAAWRVLGAGMAVSALLGLWLGRDVSFTVDEYSWISLIGQNGLGDLFDPYVGHLIVIPRLIYWLVLEVNGASSYVIFQVMSLASLFLMVGLLFVWLKKRVSTWVALAPCLILLIFPVDHLHYLTGNGITISLALAFGLAALLAWERETRAGDLLAFVFLVLGTLTYTIALPFLIGLAVAAIIGRQWRRLWIALVPLIAYGVWRFVAVSDAVEKLEGGPEWDNLLLLPAWTFQSIGAVLAALTGLGFDFSNVAGGPAVEQGRTLGPALATAAVLGLGWWLWKGRKVGPVFWVTGSILIALFASQVLVWGTIEARDPGAPRYLLPGAVVVVMVVAALLAGTKWGRGAFAGLWVIALSSIVISIGILANNTAWFETVERGARAEITALRLVESSGKQAVPPAAQPRERVRPEFSYESSSEFGNLGFALEEVPGEPGWVGKRVDAFIAGSLRLGLRPLPPGSERPKGCRPATRNRNFVPYRIRLEIPSPGAILRADAEVDLAMGRFGSWPSVDLGPIGEGGVRRLWLPFDRDETDWFIQATPERAGTLANLEICRFP
jgi:hypothetical protein